MPYCWSSIIPTTRANGYLSSTSSAAGSPVIWKPMRSGLDGEDGAVRVEQDPLGVGAKDQLADRRTPAQADDDELGLGGLSGLDEVLGGLEASDQLLELELDAGFAQLLLDRLELLLGPRDGVRVEGVAAAVGVDHHQAGSAEL